MAKNEPVQQPNEVTRITGGTEFRGTLNTISDIRIDGFFEGRLQTKGKVVLGESAKFIGDLFCISVDVWGKMEGNLVVRHHAGFMNKSSFEGALQCNKISIEDGCVFQGTCKMLTEEEHDKLLEKFSK